MPRHCEPRIAQFSSNVWNWSSPAAYEEPIRLGLELEFANQLPGVTHTKGARRLPMTRSDTTIMEDVRCPRRQFWQPTIKPSDVPRLINTNALADPLQFVLFSDLNRWAAKGIGGYN